MLTSLRAPAACRLRGGLRRLDVRTADEYDDAEYGEAVAAVFTAAERLAQHCRTGKPSASVWCVRCGVCLGVHGRMLLPLVLPRLLRCCCAS